MQEGPKGQTKTKSPGLEEQEKIKFRGTEKRRDQS
jgi:hypothetical protein